MTITVNTPTLVLLAAIILIAAAISGGKWGCRALSGCLVGVICIIIGLGLLGMSGLLGG